MNCGGSKHRVRVHTAAPIAFFPNSLERYQDPHPGPVPQVLEARQATGYLASIANARPGWVAGVKLLEFGDPFFPLVPPIINLGWRRHVF